MRIAAALRVLDEGELIDGALRHLVELGVDVIVVIDEGSTDGTLDRLAALEPEGWLWLVHALPGDPGTDDLERRLLEALQPDWWIRLAAGDRILSATGSLQDAVGDTDADELLIERYPVAVPLGAVDPGGWPDRASIAATPIRVARAVPPGPRPPWRDVPLLEGLRPSPLRLVRGQVAGRTSPDSTQDAPGDPEAPRRRIATDLIAITSPITGWDRFARQVAGERDHPGTWLDGVRDPGPAWIVDRWTRLDEPALRSAHLRQVLDPTEVALLSDHGVIRPAGEVVTGAGPRAARMPSLPDTDAYTRALGSIEPWLDGLRAAAAELGLDASLPIRHLPAKYPTAMVGEAVIRLIGPWRRGVSAMVHEATVLRWLERDPELPVPRLLGTGWIDDDWSWLAMSVLPGLPLLAVRRSLSRAELCELGTWLGGVIRRLHAVPIDPAVRRAFLPSAVEGVRALRASIVERHVGRDTLHPRLLDRLPGWLPSIDALEPALDDLVLAHLDLHDDNVLGTFRQDRFVGTGVIDFGNASLGRPSQELGAICGQTLRGDRDAIGAFLEQARLPLPAGTAGMREALCWMLMDDHDQLELVPGVRRIEDPDELADHLFGALGSWRPTATDSDPGERPAEGRAL